MKNQNPPPKLNPFPHPEKKHFLEASRETFQVVSEYVRINGFMKGLPPTISVFGSARFPKTHPYYILSYELGKIIGQSGFALLTGGGPGTMEGVSRGAKEKGGLTRGLNIVLPFEQAFNDYLDENATLNYFFIRKVMLLKYSYGYIYLPGGFGTLDELMEALNLIQTGKLHRFPVILLGKSYWNGLWSWFEDQVFRSGAASKKDLSFIHILDDPNEAVKVIKESSEQFTTTS